MFIRAWRNPRLKMTIAGLLVGLVAGIIILLAATPSDRGIPVFDKPVQNFSLMDMDGQEIRLSDYRGKPVLINFWLTTCEPCLREMPLLDEIYRRYSPNLIILGINPIDSNDSISEYLKDNPVGFPILLDRNGKIAQEYYVRGYPSTFFLDQDGVLRAQQIGELTEEALDSYLALIGVRP